MQISMLGSLSDAGGPPVVDAVVKNLATLRDEGFSRVWMTQASFELDVLTALAVALREVDTIEIGTAVLPIQNQHPMLLAQRVLMLCLIGPGRFTLGLGLSHQLITEEKWGISYDRPVRRMREYLDALLPLLAGQPANALGEIVTARGALQTSNAAAPDVYIGALGPQMLRLAGKRTAGTITWMTGPKMLAQRIVPALRQAAAEAGRPETAVRVVVSLPVSVTDDIAGARARAAVQFSIYGGFPSYRTMLDREGYSGPEDAAIIGDEKTVSDRLEELSKSGVDEFVAAIIDADPETRARARALLRACDQS